MTDQPQTPSPLLGALEVALSVALHERADPDCSGDPPYTDTQAEAKELAAFVVRQPIWQNAATEYEARLKAEAVKPWREALAEAHEHDGHTTWCNFVEVENRDKCECGFYERFEKARALLSGDET